MTGLNCTSSSPLPGEVNSKSRNWYMMIYEQRPLFFQSHLKNQPQNGFFFGMDECYHLLPFQNIHENWPCQFSGFLSGFVSDTPWTHGKMMRKVGPVSPAPPKMDSHHFRPLHPRTGKTPEAWTIGGSKSSGMLHGVPVKRPSEN